MLLARQGSTEAKVALQDGCQFVDLVAASLVFARSCLTRLRLLMDAVAGVAPAHCRSLK